jgi:hypothetical protein
MPQRLKDHFDNIGPQTQVTWERMGWGVEELAGIKGQFSLHIQVLNLLNTNLLRWVHMIMAFNLKGRVWDTSLKLQQIIS